MFVEFLLVGALHGEKNKRNDNTRENDMTGENKIVDIPHRAGLPLFRIAEEAVMVEVAKAGRRVGGMIDHIGNEEDGAENNRDPVGATVRGYLAMTDKIQARQQEDSRARIKDRME